jgi:hypothetical protein
MVYCRLNLWVDEKEISKPEGLSKKVKRPAAKSITTFRIYSEFLKLEHLLSIYLIQPESHLGFY